MLRLIVLGMRLITMHVFIKILRTLVRSQLVVMVLHKLNSIMSSRVTPMTTGHHSGSIQWRIGDGFKMLRWMDLSTWPDNFDTIGQVKAIKFHSSLQICGKVTPP